MRGLFRIDVQQHPDAPGPPGYIAHLYLVDPETRTLRPLMLDDRSPAVIYGASEPLAVNSALTYLAETFGSFAENAHGCEPPDLPLGAPLQVSGREPDRP